MKLKKNKRILRQNVDTREIDSAFIRETDVINTKMGLGFHLSKQRILSFIFPKLLLIIIIIQRSSSFLFQSFLQNKKEEDETVDVFFFFWLRPLRICRVPTHDARKYKKKKKMKLVFFFSSKRETFRAVRLPMGE